MTELIPWTAEDFRRFVSAAHADRTGVAPRSRHDAARRRRGAHADLCPILGACMRSTQPDASVHLHVSPPRMGSLPRPSPIPAPAKIRRSNCAKLTSSPASRNPTARASLRSLAFAAALGYTITITEFAPARADITCADDPCYEPEWAFVWQVNAPSITAEYACADTAFADDPLITIGNTVLQCELQRLAPAHTVLQFNYEA